MWEEFEKTVDEMMRITSGKSVVLWGYERSGWFIEHLFKLRNRPIEYIVDDGGSEMAKLRTDRSLILSEIDKETHIILLTFGEDMTAEEILKSYGYEEGIHFIFVRDIFYRNNRQRKLSYYNWLEYKYGVDIIERKWFDCIQRPSNDSNPYSAGVDYALMDSLYNFYFTKTDAVFDFGCGKGGALLLFSKRGVHKLGGVEYDQELYHTGCENLKKLGYDEKNIINGDAALVKEELDDYNYFYINNSFQGEIFDNVMKNLEESYQRNKRKVTLIYTGPFCHKSILKNSSFKLVKTLHTDYVVRYINIYVING